MKPFFTILLVLGALLTAYGALGFFVFMDLPPNNSISGRLPSSCLMFGGFAGMLIGAVGRNFRLK